MSLQKIKETSEKILNRLDAVANRGEEATKQALILPMLEALGYDIWNPAEVCPEYEADFALKKIGQKEKVDYAILIGGAPRIYIEVKAYKADLTGHQGQLARYFNATPSVSLGIITNGTEYRLFTDTGEPNIMDAEPFHLVNLEAAEQGLEVFARFQKAVFSPGAIREFATELNYTAKMVAFFKSELDLRDSEPSEYLVRWALANPGMFDGRATANVVERFRPIVKQAVQRVIREIVRRSVAALDEGVSAPAVSSTAQAQPIVNETAKTPISDTQLTTDDSEGKGKILTTERELDCFAIVKRQFETSSLANEKIYDSTTRKEVPIEVAYKDTTAYFAIYFNKPSWWIARVGIESRRPWIGFDLDMEEARPLVPAAYEVLEPSAYARLRIAINAQEDLHGLNQVFFLAFQKLINELRKDGKQLGTVEPA